MFAFAPQRDDVGAERMWVEVTAVGADAYVGTLVSHSRRIETLAPGSTVQFAARHVVAYAWDPAELGYDASLHAWVGSAALRGTAPPRIVTSRPPDAARDEADSGWTIGNGDETSLGAEQFEWASIGLLTDRFPGLEDVFRAGTGTWHWSDAEGRYARVA